MTETWGFKNGLCKNKKDCSLPYETADEVEICANLFHFFQGFKLDGKHHFPANLQAANDWEKSLIKSDRHISSHFLNLLESFRSNIIFHHSSLLPNPLNVYSSLKHCLFFDAQQCLKMVCCFATDTSGLEGQKAYERSRGIKERSANIFTEANWLDRMGFQVQEYVKGNNILKSKQGKSQTPSVAESVASNRSNIYNFYDITSSRSVITLVRHLSTHWPTLKTQSRWKYVDPKHMFQKDSFSTLPCDFRASSLLFGNSAPWMESTQLRRCQALFC